MKNGHQPQVWHTQRGGQKDGPKWLASRFPGADLDVVGQQNSGTNKKVAKSSTQKKIDKYNPP